MRFQSSRRVGVVQMMSGPRTSRRSLPSPDPGRRSRLIITSLMLVRVQPPTPPRACLLACSLLMPPFRGPGHDSAKIVGRGSIPLGGTVVVLRRRLGRIWRPKPGSSVRFAGDVLRLVAHPLVGRAGGPPCGVTAAGGISGLVTRRHLTSAPPFAWGLGHERSMTRFLGVAQQ